MLVCQSCDELLHKQDILPRTQMVDHKIGQLTAAWMDSHELECPLISRARTLYYTFVIEEYASDCCTACSGHVGTLYTQRYSITCSINDGIKREIDGFAKKTSMPHANMGHATRSRIKNQLRQNSIFTI